MHLLVKTSFLCVPSIICALSHGLYDAAALVSTVLTTSILYWTNPTRGFRRKLDITAVWVTALYQMGVMAPQSSNGLLYIITVCVGVTCYVISNTIGDPDGHVHALVHVWGNVGNLILYIGLHNPNPWVSIQMHTEPQQ
jgi:hypothetical protein